MNNLFDIKKAYYLFLLIRRSEEKIIELYNTDKIKSPVHLSIGQEAIAVGVSLALSESDIIFSNYKLILKWNRSLRFSLAVCTLKNSFENET